jgi:hypothetical protein
MHHCKNFIKNKKTTELYKLRASLAPPFSQGIFIFPRENKLISLGKMGCQTSPNRGNQNRQQENCTEPEKGEKNSNLAKELLFMNHRIYYRNLT